MTAANVEILRRGWSDAVSALAPTVEEIPALLEARLDEAVLVDQLDEYALLAVVDEAALVAMAAMAPDDATGLTRRLQRAVYEYLLSLDALRPEETDDASPGGALNGHGAEEVAALAGRPSEHAHKVERPDPTAAGEPDSAGDASVPPESSDEAEPRRPRFTLFRRGTSPEVGELPEAGEDDPSPTAEPAASADPAASEEFHVVDTEPAAFQVAEPAAPVTDLTAQFESVANPFVAPRDGFHLSDLRDLSRPVETEQESSPTQLAEEAAAEAADEPEYGGKGWRVRGRRGDTQPRRAPKTILDAPAEAPFPTALAPEELAALQNRFDTDPEVVEARRQIRDRLRRRRCDEAASLLQALAQELGGRAVAELALDAGDRCRALGKNNAALSCYLAGSRADPIHEVPLLRLADICLDDHDIDLAASYLERVARLYRLRGDDKAALRIYRKLATIAPFREDILSMLVRAQATGRFDE